MRKGIFPNLAFLLAMLMLSGISHATATYPDPEQTRIAMRALLQAAKAVVPSTSSCNGDYGQKGRTTISDVLSMQLAYLYRGDNHITGACNGKQCHLKIRHRFGEDVSSADIRFDIKNGQAIASTLQCVITP